jgi:hypothetical protein
MVEGWAQQRLLICVQSDDGWEIEISCAFEGFLCCGMEILIDCGPHLAASWAYQGALIDWGCA